MRYARWITIVLISCTMGMAACDTNALTSPLGELTQAYLPFVEEIAPQQDILAEEEFHVTLSVSAQLRPDVLNGLSKPSVRAFGYDTSGFFYSREPGINGGPERLHVFLWVVEPLRTGPAVTEFDLLFRGLPAGEYLLQFESAPARSAGGMEHGFILGEGYGPVGKIYGVPTPGTIFVELPITVQLAE